MERKLELLAPAGNLTALKAVISAGADAVYFGGSRFGARAYADNFTEEEVLEAIDFGHIHDRKVIMVINTLLKEHEMEEELYTYLLPYYERGLDAVIVQDFGVMSFIKEHFKGLPIHTSTQMTVSNVTGAKFMAKQGASRVVLAREMSLSEIAAIKNEVPVELESFVHGALCYCYSGQCLFSSMLGGRSGNRGRCAQPCRLPYETYGHEFARIGKKNELYPLSPKDLCTIDLIPEMAEAGVYSFKIEGRMKQPEYASGVVSVYRKYMDMYLNEGKEKYHVLPKDQKILFDLGNRSGFTNGYYKQYNGRDMLTIEQPNHSKSNDALQEQIRTKYIDTTIKKSVKGEFVMKENAPIRLHLSCDGVTIEKTGDIPSQARKQPLTKEVLRDKLSKTGNTPFVFEQLQIQADTGLFLTMSAINELRRQSFELLADTLLKPYVRDDASAYVPLQTANCVQDTMQNTLSVSVETMEQLETVLEFPKVHRIYVDSILLTKKEWAAKFQEIKSRIQNAGKEFYYILPAVFRKHTAAFYEQNLLSLDADGFLVKSYDAWAFMMEKKPDIKIVLDANLYSYSNRSKQAFHVFQIQADTIPFELNKKELRRRNHNKSEMVVYGHLPLMTSVQCVHNTMSGCDKKKTLHYLKDRYGIYFPVKNNCNECYNVIYNAKPLQLYPVADELKDMGIYQFRMNFTVEDEKQVRQMLKLWSDGMEHGFDKKITLGEDFTYGHYKRGVE